MDVIYSRESCCANDECNKTTELQLKIRKQLTATCYIAVVSLCLQCSLTVILLDLSLSVCFVDLGTVPVLTSLKIQCL